MSEETKAPATPEEVEESLRAAFELGKATAEAEQAARPMSPSNSYNTDPTFKAYESELSTLMATLRSENVRNPKKDIRLIALRNKHGR